MVQEEHREAHIPTQQPPARQAPWVPASDVDPRRPSGASLAAGEGSGSAVRLIGRVQDRRTFIEMRRSGLRLRSPSVSLSYVGALDQGAQPPRLALAVSKKVGNAVERNLLRRRIRSAFRELAGDPTVDLPPGAYLLSAHPTALTSTFEGLTMELRQLVVRLEALVAREPARSTDG